MNSLKKHALTGIAALAALTGACNTDKVPGISEMNYVQPFETISEPFGKFYGGYMHTTGLDFNRDGRIDCIRTELVFERRLSQHGVNPFIGTYAVDSQVPAAKLRCAFGEAHEAPFDTSSAQYTQLNDKLK
jgi:hypothetical protein